MPIPSLRRALVGAATVGLLLAGGCAGNGEAAGPEAPDRVTYLTAFGASAHDAFIFVADENGHFADAGLEVAIELGAGAANFQQLLAGQAQFSYADLTGVLISIGQGELAAGDFQALAAIHHDTLVAIVAPADAGVATPADLTGRLIGAFTGSPTELLLPAYAEAAGWSYDPDLVVPSTAQELFGLLAAGQVDVLSTFIIQQANIESIIGRETVALRFDEYLNDVLGTFLVTTSALAEQDPDLVERFRDAALAGLRDTLADPAAAIEILQSREPTAVERVEPLVDQIRVMDPYITGQGEDRIGVFDVEQVARGIEVLVQAGLTPDLEPDVIIGELTLTTP